MMKTKINIREMKEWMREGHIYAQTSHKDGYLVLRVIEEFNGAGNAYAVFVVFIRYVEDRMIKEKLLHQGQSLELAVAEYERNLQ